MIDDKFKSIIEANKGCAVVMAGSNSDEPHIEKVVTSLKRYGIPHQVRICSAHKQPDTLMKMVEEYNKIGGLVAYIAIAGGTDALSGTLSFHTYNPVISCPPDTKYSGKKKLDDSSKPMYDTLMELLNLVNQFEFNETCLKNPPGSSNAYITRPNNVGRFIAQMYAGVNPKFREILEREKTEKIESLVRSDEEFCRGKQIS